MGTEDEVGRDDLPRALPRIRLHHGQALWVLTQLGFQGAASERTFKEYIKSLRKLGTPFARGEVGPSRRSRANYSFYHLMELALILTLRVYHVVPDSVLTELVQHRRTLSATLIGARMCTGLRATARQSSWKQKITSPFACAACFWISKSISPVVCSLASAHQRCFRRLTHLTFSQSAMSLRGHSFQ